MSTRTVSIGLDLGVEQRFSIVACRVVEGISELTQATVDIASTDDIDFTGVLKESAVLELLVDGVPSRRWTLKVGRADFIEVKQGSLRFRVELHAHLWLLRHTLNTRKFRNLSATDIVSKVLGECGVPHVWRTTRTTPVRKYCAQYRESNLAFVLRLLEFEGIYYSLDPEGVLVLEDASSASPEVEGTSSHFELLDASGALDRDELGIHDLRRGAQVASGTATLSDFNWKTPKKSLLTSSAADRDAELETYDYPAGYRDPGHGALLAKMRLEAHRVPARYVEGRGNVTSFEPARAFSFGADGGAAFANDYLITSVEHSAHDPAFGESGSRTYENTFKAIPKAVPFRPAMRTLRPTISGTHTAMVRGPAGSEIHTDKFGRFRAQFHWDREAVGTDDDSRWLRMLQEPATSMTLARVGWEVSVGYIDGDPDRPIGLSRGINGVMVPAYSQPGNKNLMTIKTPLSPATGGYNELKLDDSGGTQGFFVRAERDLLAVVKHDKTEKIGNNETHVVDGGLSRGVDNNQVVTIGGNSKTTVGGDVKLSVGKNRVKIVGGNETIDVDDAGKETTNGNEVENVASVRLTVAGSIKPPNLKEMAKSSVPSPQGVAASAGKAAASSLRGGGGAAAAGSAAKGAATSSVQAMIPKPPSASMSSLTSMLLQGSIKRFAEKKVGRMVGGAYVAAGLDNITTLVKYGYAETVGGAKITVAAQGSLTQTVGGPMALTVGGAILRKSGASMGITGKNNRVTVGGMVQLSSDKKVELRGNHIVIEALTNLKLESKGLVIDLKPDVTTVEGTMRLEAGEKVIVTGKDDKLTK